MRADQLLQHIATERSEDPIVRPGGRAGPEIALFQLSGRITYPDLSTAPRDHFDREPCAWANAQRMSWGQAQPSDKTFLGGPVLSWYPGQKTAEQKIWFPAAPRTVLGISPAGGTGTWTGFSIGPPAYEPGDRVFCRLYGQRWECLADPPYRSCWGVLQEQLNAGSSATVSLWWGGGFPGLNVTAYDWLLATGTNLPALTKVKVEYFPQDGVWWVTAAACQ
jgi:hypothetical protein